MNKAIQKFQESMQDSTVAIFCNKDNVVIHLGHEAKYGRLHTTLNYMEAALITAVDELLAGEKL